jgi:hypothetical protein
MSTPPVIGTVSGVREHTEGFISDALEGAAAGLSPADAAYLIAGILDREGLLRAAYGRPVAGDVRKDLTREPDEFGCYATGEDEQEPRGALICLRAAGHEDPHIAFGTHGKVLAVGTGWAAQ